MFFFETYILLREFFLNRENIIFHEHDIDNDNIEITVDNYDLLKDRFISFFININKKYILQTLNFKLTDINAKLQENFKNKRSFGDDKEGDIKIINDVFKICDGYGLDNNIENMKLINESEDIKYDFDTLIENITQELYNNMDILINKIKELNIKYVNTNDDEYRQKYNYIIKNDIIFNKNCKFLDILVSKTKRFNINYVNRLFKLLTKQVFLNHETLNDDDEKKYNINLDSFIRNVYYTKWYWKGIIPEEKANKLIEFINNNKFDDKKWIAFKHLYIDVLDDKKKIYKGITKQGELPSKRSNFIEIFKKIYKDYDPFCLNSPLFRISFIIEIKKLKLNWNFITYRDEKPFIELLTGNISEISTNGAILFVNEFNRSINKKQIDKNRLIEKIIEKSIKYKEDYGEKELKDKDIEEITYLFKFKSTKVCEKFDFNDLKEGKYNDEKIYNNIYNASKIFFLKDN